MRKFVRKMAGKAKDELVKAGKSAKDEVVKSVKKTYKKARDHFDKEIDVSKLKDETLDDMARAAHRGKIYDDDGVLKRKSKLHRAAEVIENHPKTAAVGGLGLIGAGLSDDEDEDDVMAEIKRKIRDDKPLTAAEKRLLRLMEE